MASEGDDALAPRLTRDAERFLVRDVADGAAGYFGGIAGREGFAKALGNLFRELEMGGFAGGTLPRALGASSGDETSKFGQIARLFAAYEQQPDLMPPGWRERVPAAEPERSRHVVDFIAGMTDRYAIERYRRVFREAPEELSNV